MNVRIWNNHFQHYLAMRVRILRNGHRELQDLESLHGIVVFVVGGEFPWVKCVKSVNPQKRSHKLYEFRGKYVAANDFEDQREFFDILRDVNNILCAFSEQSRKQNDQDVEPPQW